jgi:CheY-like chemotaxis protein
VNSACILIVEDEETVRSLLAQVLRLSGYQVLVACDGPEALALFREQPDRLDLVLLDLCMPGPDGLQTLAEMARLRPDLRAVLMSGLMPQDLPVSPEVLVGTISKPFRPSDLVALVGQALGR